jgi:hypothetical protein
MKSLLLQCVSFFVFATSSFGETNAVRTIEILTPTSEWSRQYNFRNLTNINNIYSINLEFMGSAETLLDRRDLLDFVKLKARSTFPSFTFKELPPEAYFDDKKGTVAYKGINIEKYASMTMRVWTVGTNEFVPVPVHVQVAIEGMNYAGRGDGGLSYVREGLGLTSVRGLQATRTMKDMLMEMLELAATEILKLQGKL